MANCQNPMRYGRQTPMYSQRNTCNTCGISRQNPRPAQECPALQEPRMSRPLSDCREHTKHTDHTEKTSGNCGVHAEREKRCFCGKDPLWEMPLAMAYVPWQRWQKIYDICDGFQCGTIFRELDQPFHGKGGCNR